MYHIPEDRRALASALRLSSSLEKTLQRKALRQITVTEICRTARTGRATFYRLFDNLTDVLAWQCDRIMDESAEEISSETGPTVREISVLILKKWMCRPLLMKTLLENGQIDILHRAHVRNLPALQAVLADVPGANGSAILRLVGIVCRLLPAYLSVWHERGETGTAEDLYQEIREDLSLVMRVL